MKSGKVYIKTKLTPASLSLKGWGTKHTTVKWSVRDQRWSYKTRTSSIHGAA